MTKFRKMRIDTPVVTTHLLKDPDAHLTPIGPFLIKSRLDELPQLWGLLKGDMVFVGPRPAIHNQNDLDELRTKVGVHELIPDVTGWAQINGRDELSIIEKVKFDEFYLRNRSRLLHLKIVFLILIRVLGMKGVSH
jgi:O-antigen biosynthesis protein WbqP